MRHNKMLKLLVPSPCLQNFRVLSHENLHKSFGINITFRIENLS